MVECVNCAKFKGCNFSNPYLHECVDYQETQTNEQWIKQCTTEQLAECIIGIDYGADDKDTKIAKLVEWLNRPHTFIDY